MIDKTEIQDKIIKETVKNILTGKEVKSDVQIPNF